MTDKRTWYLLDMHQLWLDNDQPTGYSINKSIGISANTADNYFREGGYYVRAVPSSFYKVAQFFGVNWKDYVSVVEIDADIQNPNEDSSLKVNAPSPTLIPNLT